MSDSTKKAEAIAKRSEELALQIMRNEAALKHASQFSIGQTVYMYVAPMHSNQPETTPVWECVIEDIITTHVSTVSKYPESQKDVVKIELGVKFGWHSKTYPADNFFTTLAAAKKYAISELNRIKAKRIERVEEIESAMVDLIQQGVDKKVQQNCDHDWEDMDDYMQCTYPECQAIKRKDLNEISFDELEDGKVYSFKHEGDFYIGKYEMLSGNFFVGGDQSLQNHDLYFEASQCVIFKNDA